MPAFEGAAKHIRISVLGCLQTVFMSFASNTLDMT